VPEPPHDILAAEAFVVPAPDPELHRHGPVQLPDDPTGIAEPHDVLAAEEFAMPAPRPGGDRPRTPAEQAKEQRGAILLLAAGLLAVLVVLRRFLQTG
jgi:hypothetical protein